MSAALEDVDLRIDVDTTTGNHDRFSHYVRQDDIIRSTFDGTPAIALCGKVWVANKTPDGLTVCPECKEVYEDDQRLLDSDV